MSENNTPNDTSNDTLNNLSVDLLKKEFDRACNYIKISTDINIPDDVKLNFYGLYKVAKNIKYVELSSFTFNPTTIAKNNAHKKYINLKDTNAMKQYILLCITYTNFISPHNSQ